MSHYTPHYCSQWWWWRPNVSYLEMARFIWILAIRSSFCCCRTWTLSSRNTFFWACSKVKHNHSVTFHSPHIMTIMRLQSTVRVCVCVRREVWDSLFEPTTFSRSEIFFSCWCICWFFISTTSFKLFRSCSMCWYGARASCYRGMMLWFGKIWVTIYYK